MLAVDSETNRRCAAAALGVLRGELDRLQCAPAERDRLLRLANMAQGHLAELVGGAVHLADDAPRHDDAARHGAGNLHEDAAAAWRHAAALRQSTTQADADFHRAQLRAVAAGTSSARVRLVCRNALAI